MVMGLGQSLHNKCIEQDGKVILQWLEELHTKWDYLDTQLMQRKVLYDNETISNKFPSHLGTIGGNIINTGSVSTSF